MAADNAKKLRLYEDIFNAEGMTDALVSERSLTQPDVLSPVITHLAGKEDKEVSSIFSNRGVGAVNYINDIEYDYPVMGRLNKTVRASSLVSGSGLTLLDLKLSLMKNGSLSNTLLKVKEESKLELWKIHMKLTVDGIHTTISYS